MPENYITIAGEEGSVHISEDVIASITAAAVSEVEGVGGFSNTPVAELIGKRSAPKGIRVSFEEDAVQIDVTVLAHSAFHITTLAGKVQKAAAAAVESMTGLHCTVNVHVAGVIFDK